MSASQVLYLLFLPFLALLVAWLIVISTAGVIAGLDNFRDWLEERQQRRKERP